MDLEHGQISVNGMDIAYLASGPEGAPLALCLHGFPDSAHTWRHLLPALAGAGFRAVAPWMRGYAPTTLLPGASYQTGALVADATSLHEALGGHQEGVLVGHDWGAVAAYGAATHAPERWRRVVTAAVPPAEVLAGAFLSSYDQLRRSWYMFFFQHPLSDLAVAANDLAFIDRLWADWSPGYDASTDLGHVKDSLRAPENLAAAVAYYRATLGTTPHDPDLTDEQAATQATPPQPTLYLHGRADGCVGVELAEETQGRLSTGSRVEIVDGAGHFLHLEQPDSVNDLILAFLEG